jgi:uncharacterized protein YyaL (SSP411 family)
MRGGAVASVLASVLIWILPATLARDASDDNRSGHTADAPRTAAFTNRLIDSNDPYLLLHAHNPVDWYPWGPEALAKAKQENKPIFVSIGYSTCFWCHVAERTIYSDPQIAALMNQWFINIKVDREQRPDLDSIYMLATELMSGNGGWPNNVFLTPDLKPFYAGSYFPPHDDGERPGFPTILKSLHAAWIHHHQEVLQHANEVYTAMRQLRERPTSGPATPFDPAVALRRARGVLFDDVDQVYGGFGSGPTKFPREPDLALLLADYRSSHLPKVRDALVNALDAMALGGIHDHLGGGFHRYSTEPTWSVPHFEKMLYDNAQLLSLYTEAYQTTQAALYAQVANDIAQYLTRQMAAPRGGFYAAEDAEVSGREGVSYLWSRKEIESVLGKSDAIAFLQVYALTPLPKSAVDINEGGGDSGILRIRMPVSETLRQIRATDLASTLTKLGPARARLLAARERRPQPARDEKIIVAWNGLAIDALARSTEILRQPAYLELAKRTAARLWTDAYDPRTGELKHEIFRDRAQVHGYLDDYALLGIAFLSLADATHETEWRDRAVQLATALMSRFFREGTLATTVAATDLLILPEDDGDNTMPSGTSATVEFFARLHASTGRREYANALQGALAGLGSTVQERPQVWASAVVALNRYSAPQAADTQRLAEPPPASGGPAAPSTADHVRARGEAHSAVDHDDITVILVVDPGYHVNANPASFDYLIPTRLWIEGLNNVRVRYPDATVIRPKFAPEGLKVYSGDVRLQATAPKGAVNRDKRPVGHVHVQACNDEICLPPATLPILIKTEE